MKLPVLCLSLLLLLVPLVHGFGSSATCSDSYCDDSSSYGYCCVTMWDTASCDSGYTVETDTSVSYSCSSRGGDTSFTCCKVRDEDQENLYGCTYDEASCDNDGIWDYKQKCYDGMCRTSCSGSYSWDEEPWTCPLCTVKPAMFVRHVSKVQKRKI